MNNRMPKFFSQIMNICAAMVALCLAFPKSAAAQGVTFPAREISSIMYDSMLSASTPNVLYIENNTRSLMLTDPSFHSKMKYKSNLTFVKFAVNHASVHVPSAGYIYKMMYQIEGSNKLADSTYNFSATDSLIISFDPDSLSTVQDIQSRVYPNLYNAKLTIIQLFDMTSGTPVAVTNPATLSQNFFIELGMRYQPFLKTHYVPADMQLTTSSQFRAAVNRLRVNWAPANTPYTGNVTPAQYELEWTYTDDYGPNSTPLPPGSVRYDFRNNATRIITDQDFYDIPVIYPRGYLAFRVRMVRVDSNTYTTPIYGIWSVQNDQGTIQSLSAGTNMLPIGNAYMNDSVNWNYTIRFAEQGKYKHVLSHYDGLLKNRQTITRFNTSPSYLLVTENIYDYEGRPAITTLPTPVSTDDFHYLPGVSISQATNQPYGPADFDIKPSACPDETVEVPFRDNSLANLYYSPLNFDTSGIQKFVPQAEGYPFIHTRLSPGFSDRVDKMGGAGKALQIGNGHETKYEYAEADQNNLNRLFGLNAGFRSFYNQVITTDPNGQLSLQIKDYQGRQMATSLIGASVDTTRTALVFNDEVPPTSLVREDRLANAQQLVVGHEKKYNGNFFMDYDAMTNVRYEYTFAPYTVCPAPYLGLSVEGRYKYSITDACGKVRLDKNGVLGTTGVITTPNPPPAVHTDAVSLEDGVYTLDKTLTINTDDIYAAVDSFFVRKPNCAKTEDQFIKEEVERTPFPCPDSLIDPCAALERQMMEDLFPNRDSASHTTGKYGRYTVSPLVLGMTPSIFDRLGAKDSSNLYRYQLPCVAAELNSLTINKYGRNYTNIGSLPVDTFLMLYTGPDRYTIAHALLPLHPEYCRLKNCFVDTFETRLKAMPDAATATKYGMFTLSDIVNKDIQLRTKLMNPPVNMQFVADSLKLMFRGTVRMDTLASEMAFCLNDDVQVYGDAKEYFHDDITGLNMVSPGVRNIFFDKLRTFYLANREKYKSIARTAGGNACAPCDDARMALLPPPRVVVAYNPDGSFNVTGPDGLVGLFSTSMQSTVAAVLSQGATPISDPDTIQKLQDSATAYVHRVDSVLNYIAVDSAMSRMINCFSNPSMAAALRSQLVALVQGGVVHNGVFLPHQIRRALALAGISPTDLCHPYLFSYDYYDDGVGRKGSCASATFYGGVRDFFNDPDINHALRNTTSVQTQFPVSWNTTNLFATMVADSIRGGTGNILVSTVYEPQRHVYRLKCYRQGSDTVQLSLRAPDSVVVNGTSYPALQTSGNLVFDQVSCYFEDPQAVAEGYIGRFMFRASVTRTDDLGGGTMQETKAGIIGWNNAKLPMSDENSGNVLANCVPCTQFKAVYQSFADSMSAYGGYYADHPLFYRSLRSFMNYSLKKVFSENQYSRFLQSCALADSMVIPMLGGYIRMSLPSYNNFSNFAAQVAATDTFVIKALIRSFNPGTGMEEVIVNANTIPYHKLRSFIQNELLPMGAEVNIPAGGIFGDPAGCIGTLWVPENSPVNENDIIYGSSASFYPVSIDNVDISGNINTRRYHRVDIYTDYPAATVDLSRGIAAIAKALRDNNIGGYWFPTKLATVNSDYYKDEKQDLLAYTYSMQGLAPSKVLDTLQDFHLESQLSRFIGKDVSYSDPSNPYRFTDLYFSSDPTRMPGYKILAGILGSASTRMGGPILLPTAMNSLNGGVPAPEALQLYRCSDGLYWYRYFDASQKLYNVFIRVPAFVFRNTHNNLVVHKIIPSTGDSATRRFTISLVDRTAPNDTVYAEGSTDFDIAYSSKLSDVLLGNDADYHATTPLSGEVGSEPNCEQLRLTNAINTGRTDYRNYIDSFRRSLKAAFYAHVMSQVREKLFIEYIDMRFGTTLYNYDLAGNLIRTVPPEGVHKLDSTAATAVDDLRQNNTFAASAVPPHTKVTSYEYNTLNNPLREQTPDAGLKTTSYDAKGNIVLTQNERQRGRGLFSYILYDKQNRVTETGEVLWGDCPAFTDQPLYVYNTGTSQWTKTLPPNGCACEDATDSLWRYCVPNTNIWIDNATFANTIRSKNRTQVVYSVYDTAFIDLRGLPGMERQENLRNRIATSLYYEAVGPGMPPVTGYTHATHYSYDELGNVKTATQDFPELEGMWQRYKRVDYDYDVLSGKVNMVSYNRGHMDQFYQRYAYDADNRITRLETSRDGFIWKRDAEYTYYQHGPLGRVSLGEQRVQGIDYAYTLQGWLKTINGARIDTLLDMGADGTAGNITPKDVFATGIDYFKGDYQPIGQRTVSDLPDPTHDLYNGNIARQTTDIAPYGALTAAYTYDQMNRIRAARYGKMVNNALAFNNWYASAYKYDQDGNIRMLTRRDGTGALMDSLVYSYPNVKNNQLADVLDYASFNQPGVPDIKPYTQTGLSRMLYDENGSLVKDLTSNQSLIGWNIYGKMTDLTDSIAKTRTHFHYDGAGNRVSKTITIAEDSSGSLQRSYYYMRDASGNILAEYNTEVALGPEGLVPTIRRIRGQVTGTPAPVSTTPRIRWLNALNTMGYTLSPWFREVVFANGTGTQQRYPAGYYLYHDASLLQQFTANTAASLLPALNTYSRNTGDYPVAEALFARMAGEFSVDAVGSPLFGNANESVRVAAARQMAALVPDIYLDMQYQAGVLQITSSSDSAKVDAAIHDMAVNYPSYFTDMAFDMLFFAMQDTGRRQVIMPWLRQVSTEPMYQDLAIMGDQSLRPVVTDALYHYSAQMADAAALQLPGNPDPSTVGLFGFVSSWPQGMAVLSELADSAQLEQISYDDDPVTFLSARAQQIGDDFTDEALAKVPALDLSGLAAKAGVSLASIPERPVKHQEIHLTNHHLYGSSRVGISGYWPGQYALSWDYEDNRIDTFRLRDNQPWYSYRLNELLRSDTSKAYWGGLLQSMAAKHILGQKQYELSNQLGNVQATVSDKRYVKDVNGDGLRDGFSPAVVASYDYYPFGMLMPGRTLTDTAQHCANVTQVQLIPRINLPGLSAMNQATSLRGATLGTIQGVGYAAYGRTGGMQFTNVPVTRRFLTHMSVNLTYIYSGFIDITVRETVNGNSVLLASVRTNMTGVQTLSFTPSTASVTLEIAQNAVFTSAPSGGMFAIANEIPYERADFVPRYVITQICNQPKDKYPMGFNGQMKDNEIAGVGNHMDYGDRGYDSRIGHWWSRDNKAPKYPMLSPYAFSGNNPIVFKDYDGQDFGVKISNNSVVILATIYTVNEKAYNQALKGAAIWNAKTATIDGSTVSFQIKVEKPYEISREEVINLKPSNLYTKTGEIDENAMRQNQISAAEYKAATADEADNTGNYYGGSVNGKIVSGEIFTGGVTKKGHKIDMNTHTGIFGSEGMGDIGQYPRAVAHEIGHLFGLDDKGGKYYSPGGIMQYVPGEQKDISDNDVRNIIKYANDAISDPPLNDSKVEILENTGSGTSIIKTN